MASLEAAKATVEAASSEAGLKLRGRKLRVRYAAEGEGQADEALIAETERPMNYQPRGICGTKVQ
jgi:hypothetical protein